MANKNLLEIKQQRVDNAGSIIMPHLNIDSFRKPLLSAIQLESHCTKPLW